MTEKGRKIIKYSGGVLAAALGIYFHKEIKEQAIKFANLSEYTAPAPDPTDTTKHQSDTTQMVIVEQTTTGGNDKDANKKESKTTDNNESKTTSTAGKTPKKEPKKTPPKRRARVSYAGLTNNNAKAEYEQAGRDSASARHVSDALNGVKLK